jgi:hypothetical protein
MDGALRRARGQIVVNSDSKLPKASMGTPMMADFRVS